MNRLDYIIRMDLVEDVSIETMTCPFCGNSDNPFRSLMALMLSVPIHYVKCESCGGCGPLSVKYPDRQSAIDAWNDRFVAKWTINEGEKDV